MRLPQCTRQNYAIEARGSYLHVHLDGFAHIASSLFAGFSSGYTAWQVGRIRGKILVCFFDYDEEAVHSLLLFFLCLFQLRLLQNAIPSSGSKVIAWVSCNGHSTRFLRMFILAMTSFCGYQIPTIFRDQPDRLTDFHLAILAQINREVRLAEIALPC